MVIPEQQQPIRDRTLRAVWTLNTTLGIDEIALAAPGNAVGDPGIAGCFDPKAPSFGPKGELPAAAVSDPTVTAPVTPSVPARTDRPRPASPE
mgnify:CR=1 FL=1